MKALTFPKSHRLLRPGDYGKVFDDVQLKVPHRNFLVLATPNSLGHARVGLIFSKKNLKLAVQRNRIKRQVRESFRQQVDLPGLDVVVLGRQGLANLENAAVQECLNDLWRRLKKKHRQLQPSRSDPSEPAG
ncbi:MAG: ribonuclease P protein component [Gammaproteobacteria bacterium]|uniref:Ribonuclease P protein component n=1 Tax=Marinobacter nitratireducens TaxID=1137280 RepID=A0A072MYA5_9GAMM|nr:ribonuclease P protein component [Marinobacter nitratireducens]KEF30409.1 Ribonuclease P protein component [Marinobacter nitratireducens]TNE81453.1 MAG: ribonuclease P protein component [Gammaproteobacteria bacterium]TNE99696.1 MAG: ribonuclease P protein component [Gammaproteobacteria bacterium]